ncbi:MAG: tetratricopeptide repeat protein [Anaerolineae bacterium]
MDNEHLMIESRDDFGEPCPRCGKVLADHTFVDQDEGYLFFRTLFRCASCGYWLRTRRENFNTLGPIGDEASELGALPSEMEQRVRLDLTHKIVRQFMPNGVESYECGRVWTSSEEVVSKTWSMFSTGGLHLVLAGLGTGYLERGDRDLGICAYELAVQEIRSRTSEDPTFSTADPQNCDNVARILTGLAYLYRQQGRIDDADKLSEEAFNWAPESFKKSDSRKSGRHMLARLRDLLSGRKRSR